MGETPVLQLPIPYSPIFHPSEARNRPLPKLRERA